VSEAIRRKIIQRQPHVQHNPNTKLRDLLKRKKAKTRKLRELSQKKTEKEKKHITFKEVVEIIKNSVNKDSDRGIMCMKKKIILL